MINNKELKKFFIYNEGKIISIFFLIYILFGFLIYKDYGFNIDEKFQRTNGFYWLKYLSNFFGFEELNILARNKLDAIGNFTLPDVNYINIYGIIFDVPAAYLEILFEINNELAAYQLRHFLTFFSFWIASIFFYLLIKNRFKNTLISIFGLLIFITTPRLFGDAFHNNKDIIFLTFYTISIFYYFRLIDNSSLKNLLFLSCFAAIATTIRILGVFIPISLIFLFIVNKFSKKKNFKFSLVFFHIILYLFFLFIFWPLFWEDTFLNFIKYFEIIKVYGSPKILFLGQYYSTHLLPFYYLSFWVIISTPFFYLCFFFLGIGFYINRFLKRFFNTKLDSIYNDLWRSKSEGKDFLIFINLITFLLFFSFFGVHHYNSWRLAYFIYIFIIYFAIYGFYLLKIKSRKKPKFNFLLIIFFLIGSCFNIYRLNIYHPYQSFYFNIFAPKKIKDTLEVDYVGLSGIHFLNQIISQEKNSKQIKIGIASWYPLWFMVDLLDEQDKKKIKIISNKEIKNSDYIYSNRISEVDKRYYKKYDVPENFKKIEFKIDNTIIYEIYKK